MRRFIRNLMQTIASYMELALSGFLAVVLIMFIIRSVYRDIPLVWFGNEALVYFLETILDIAVGVEFVKMLCQHTPATIVEVLLFSISRQMVVERLTTWESLVGVAAIAGLFATRKFLFTPVKHEERYVFRASQSVALTNTLIGVRIPASDGNEILRDVIVRKLREENRTIAIGAVAGFDRVALRIDNMHGDFVTRVEVIRMEQGE